MMATPADARETLASLRAGVSGLADDLYRLETDPEVQLAREGNLQGQSAQLFAEASGRSQSLWERYPLLQAAVDELDAAIQAGDRATQDRLLGPDAIRLADGTTTSLLDLGKALRHDIDAVISASARLATAWRTVLPRLDAAAATLAHAAKTADGIGIGHDPLLRTARNLLDSLKVTATTDPLAVDPAPAEEAVERARHRVDDLASKRAELPKALEAARTLLDDLATLIPEGQAALDETKAKILRPTGLLEPLFAAAVDTGTQALRPWLARLERSAEDGQWLPAVEGLGNWHRVADGWLANARRIVAANRAPILRRNELRGLLDAYRAKAGATGLAEDPKVEAIFTAARAALYSAPCDLDAATELVTRYGEAVND